MSINSTDDKNDVAGHILMYVHGEDDVALLVAYGPNEGRVYKPKGAVDEGVAEIVAWLQTQGVERVETSSTRISQELLTDEKIDEWVEAIRKEFRCLLS
jgi:hypothetical protein